MVETAQKYEVKLEIFEGPLDLLVYLVQKSELEPRDIPICLITEQYLEYLDNVDIKNLSHAGDYLVMASRLMRLKAQELLPDEDKDEIENLEIDLDKEALVQQMIEYQTFKGASNYLKHFETRNFGAFSRGMKERLPQEKTRLEDITIDADIYELMTAFSKASVASKTVPIHDIEIDDVTIENQIKKIQQFLNAKPKCHFEELFEDDPRRILIVVSFMAVLEMGKLNEIYSRQHEGSGAIWIYKNTQGTEPDFEIGPIDMTIKDKETIEPGLVDFIRADIEEKQKRESIEESLALLQPDTEAEIDEEGEEKPETETGAEIKTATAILAAPENASENIPEVDSANENSEVEIVEQEAPANISEESTPDVSDQETSESNPQEIEEIQEIQEIVTPGDEINNPEDTPEKNLEILPQEDSPRDNTQSSPENLHEGETPETPPDPQPE